MLRLDDTQTSLETPSYQMTEPVETQPQSLTCGPKSGKIPHGVSVTSREDRGESVMVVQCPQCMGKYRVADESKVPVDGIGVRCPTCANIFTIYRIAADIELIPIEGDYQEPVREPVREAPTVFEPTPSPSSDLGISTEPLDRGLETPSSVVEESVFEPKPEVFEPSAPTTFEETPEVVPEVSAPVTPEPVEISAAPPTFEPEPEVAASPQVQKQHDKAKRLARVLVKDILRYHGDKVEEGLRNGNLIDMVGDEIKKSWQYYKSELPEDVLNSTNYFKEALNKILAKGKKIFT